MDKYQIDELARDPRFISSIGRHHRHRALHRRMGHKLEPPAGLEDLPRLLVTLKNLLKLVETSFPNARSFLRPGFETTS